MKAKLMKAIALASLNDKKKKHRKHRISEREKHDKNATAKRSEQHQRSESSND